MFYLSLSLSQSLSQGDSFGILVSTLDNYPGVWGSKPTRALFTVPHHTLQFNININTFKTHRFIKLSKTVLLLHSIFFTCMRIKIFCYILLIFDFGCATCLFPMTLLLQIIKAFCNRNCRTVGHYFSLNCFSTTQNVFVTPSCLFYCL